MLSAWQARQWLRRMMQMTGSTVSWGLGSQDCSRRCVESPPRPRRGASEQCALPHARAFVECAVLCGAAVRCAGLSRSSLARVLVQRRAVASSAFSLPTSTSSARGVVQFWLTRRPTPAAIYGHRHPGGVSGLALSSRIFSHSPLSVRQFGSNPIILGVRAQQRRSGSTFTTYTIPPRYPPSIHFMI